MSGRIRAVNDEPFQPERLKQAMAVDLMTQGELALRAGVSRRKVRAWLGGDLQPSAWESLFIAAALRQPVAFFYWPPFVRVEGPAFVCGSRS